MAASEAVAVVPAAADAAAVAMEQAEPQQAAASQETASVGRGERMKKEETNSTTIDGLLSLRVRRRRQMHTLPPRGLQSRLSFFFYVSFLSS